MRLLKMKKNQGIFNVKQKGLKNGEINSENIEKMLDINEWQIQ